MAQAPEAAPNASLIGEVAVKPGLPDHPKVYRLAERLGIEDAHSLGIIVRLWDRVASACDSGILRGWTARDFARQIGWRGDAGALLAGLHSEGWLDRSSADPTLYAVHDWPEEAPRFVAQRWARGISPHCTETEARLVARASYSAAAIDRRSPTDRSSAADDRPVAASVLDCSALDCSGLDGTEKDGSATPSLRRSLSGKPDAKAARAKKPKGSDDGFEVLWSAYPHFGARRHKAESLKRWRALGLAAVAHHVMGWLAVDRQSDDWTKECGRFVPACEVWLRAKGLAGFNEAPPDLANVASSQDIYSQQEDSWTPE